jgi:two-component system, OmpR family, sensor histidine kinase VicK
LPLHNETKADGGVSNFSGHEQVKNQSIQILSDRQRIKLLYLSMVRSAQKEVQLIFPSANAIRREEQLGIFGELEQAVQRGVSIRVLTAEDDFVKVLLDALRTKGIIVRRIEAPSEAKFKLLIVDRSVSLVIETKDDSKATFEQAVGLATFSNSKATVLPYVTIFESFWRETELYEKAQEAERLKDEFVNISAHELRNPITPIMAGADFAIEQLKKIKEGKFDEGTISSLTENLNMILRNASKIHRLSEDLLQVSKLESGTFTLHVEEVQLKQILEQAVEDAKKKAASQNKDVKIILDYILKNESPQSDFILYCDGSKIAQVLYNVLDNAIKFTEKGDIVLSVSMYNENNIVIKVEDSGPGIDPSIKDKLFEKFTSKSHNGTGLGLFLSRKIVEAHGGSIWAADNPRGNGATFAFTMPIDPNPIATHKTNQQLPA